MRLFQKLLLEIEESPIVLSHHPQCGNFEDHCFKLRGHSICKGCATVYPVAILTILLILLFGVANFTFLFYASLIFLILNCYRFIIPRSEFVGFVMNTFLGISLGTVILSIIFAPDDTRLLWTIFVFIVASLFMFIKGLRVFMVCRRCPRYDSFPRCGK